nr:hypothetical protein [Tanacetum cinerariifolium]
IIEEYESDSDDDSTSNVPAEKEKPSFAFTDTAKHVKTSRDTAANASAGCNWRNKRHSWNRVFNYNSGSKIIKSDDLHKALKDKGIVDSGCSRHMTGNKAHLTNYQDFKGGYVAFGGSNGRITGKGKIKDGRLDFEDVYYVEELKHCNLFFVSQMCDKKNKVLFTDTDCLVLSPDFKLPDENQGNLVRGLPSKIFENDHTCDACQKGKQHKASCPSEAKNSVCIQANDDQGANSEEIDHHDEHFVLPIWSTYSTIVRSLRHKIQKTTDCKTSNDALRKEATHDSPDANTNSTNLLNAVSVPVSAVGPSRALNDVEPPYPDDPSMPHLEDIFASSTERIFTNSSYDDELFRRSKLKKNSEAHALVSYIQKQQRNNHKDFQHCLFACFLSQIKPKKISQVLEDKIWVDAMQEELLQLQIQKVWILVDLPFRKKVIGTKWVYRNKKDERGVVVRNKARLVAQGHRQEEGIDYDEVFAPVARIEAISIFFALASYMGFIVYQMDVKSAYLYGTINEEVYVIQSPGFIDLKFPNKFYKRSRYRRGAINKTLFIKQDKKDIMLFRLQVKQKEDGIFISQDKYVAEILKKFDFLSVKTASTPIETQKPLVKDEEAANVDVHLYRRLISWQCKKQTILATSTTEAEYVAAVDKDAYEKKLIQVLKIHTNYNVADLLTNAFDVSSKELASLKQMALGVNTPRCDEDSFELKELMVFFVPICVEKDKVGVNAEKPTESEGFEQIIDFLNGSSVRYALTASPTIRTSCIKQFWSTTNVKTTNDEVRVHFLIDAKRVNIKESSICHTLKLDDEEGTSCLANDEILTSLANMGYEKISDKLTFYKAFFSPQWKFLIHTILHCLSAKTTYWNEFSSIMASAIICLATNQKFNFLRYILLSLVKNIEAGVPFYMFLSQAQDDVSISTEPSTSKPYKKHKLKKQQAIAPKVPSPEHSPKHQLPSPSNDPIPTDKDSLKLQEGRMIVDMDEDVEVNFEEAQAKAYNLDLQHSKKVLSMQDIDEEEPAEVEEVLEVVTTAKLITEVVTTAEPTTTAAQVPKVSAPRRRRGVVTQDPEETTTTVIMHTKVQSKDKGKGILIEEPKPLKGMTYIEIRPLFEKHYNLNQAFLEKVEEEVTVQEKDIKEEEATPLASKVPVVDYQIHHENNKPYYKIIIADGSHKLFLSFITLLKNFDREDLETLWKLVKERRADMG